MNAELRTKVARINKQIMLATQSLEDLLEANQMVILIGDTQILWACIEAIDEVTDKLAEIAGK